MKNKNKNKIWFIIFISLFGIIWLTSLVFWGLSSFSDNIRNSIETWYSTKNEDSTLNLTKVSMYGTVLSTIAIIITLLAQEIKKRYR